MKFQISNFKFQIATPGYCYLIGAGPGDPELLTLRGQAILQKADVIVYDYLCHPSLLRWSKPDAELIFAGKLSGNPTLKQEETNQLLIEKAKAGKIVARLKGGDPYIFGRGGEEATELIQAQVPFEVVPGVSSINAVPAYAGIPITHRDYCSSFLVATGHVDPKKGETLLDYSLIANFTGTRILLMGVGKLREITNKLMEAGANPKTPSAVIQWGTLGRQKTVCATLKKLADQVEAQQLTAPAVIILGDVVNLRETLNWFEKKPLFGKKILITRARTQAGELAQKLRLLGADVLELPLIKITPLIDSEPLQNAATTCTHYDWLVFTSLNGIETFFQQFQKLSLDIRQLAPLKIAVVGKESAKILAQYYHLQADLIAPQSTSQSLSHALTQLDLRDKKILLIQGNRASPELQNNLTQHSAQVNQVEAYRTELEMRDIFQTRPRLETEGVDCIVFTSASTVEHWHQLKLKLPKPWQAISIGPITTQKLQQLSYTSILQSQEPSLDGIISTILNQTISAKA
ncbi:MAG: uroporphyrinogen-III C-methyltransferase [Verrucomicrobiae bacterium]|nr:uroporphyrinogen-III C-methyltransferase [Verrucomicrobiae bacterium]